MPGETGIRLASTIRSPCPDTITKVSGLSCWCGSECRPAGTLPQLAPTPSDSTAAMSISPRSMPNERCSELASYVLTITCDSLAPVGKQFHGLGRDRGAEPVAGTAGRPGEDDPASGVQRPHDRFTARAVGVAEQLAAMAGVGQLPRGATQAN